MDLAEEVLVGLVLHDEQFTLIDEVYLKQSQARRGSFACSLHRVVSLHSVCRLCKVIDELSSDHMSELTIAIGTGMRKSEQYGLIW